MPEPATTAAADPAAATIPAPVAASAAEAGDWKSALVAITSPDTNPVELYVNPAIKASLWGASRMLSQSKFIPERFAGKPEEVFIGLTVAARLKMDPLALFPQMYVVHGTPALSSKLKIQLANQRGPFEGGVRFEMFGEPGTIGRGCRAYAKYKGSDSLAEVTVNMDTAKRAGWLAKSGSWWNISPDKMLRYRAGGWLVDEYCPEVSMGMVTSEEAEDMAQVIQPRTAPAAALLDLPTGYQDPASATETTLEPAQGATPADPSAGSPSAA